MGSAIIIMHFMLILHACFFSSPDIDECASNPCRNGGICLNLFDRYICACPVAFTGTNCELSKDILRISFILIGL